MCAPFHIRPAEPGDVDVLHQFVVELAAAERFPVRSQLDPSTSPALFSRKGRWPMPW